MGLFRIRFHILNPEERWHLWAFSNNIAESYNISCNIAHKHTTRAGATGRKTKDLQSKDNPTEEQMVQFRWHLTELKCLSDDGRGQWGVLHRLKVKCLSDESIGGMKGPSQYVQISREIW
jgi:hypothetical protein